MKHLEIARRLLAFNAKERAETPEVLAMARARLDALKITFAEGEPAAVASDEERTRIEHELKKLYLRLSLRSTPEETKASIRLTAGYLELKLAEPTKAADKILAERISKILAQATAPEGQTP